MPTCYVCNCELKSKSVKAHLLTKKHLKNDKTFDYVEFRKERAESKKWFRQKFSEMVYKRANNLA